MVYSFHKNAFLNYTARWIRRKKLASSFLFFLNEKFQTTNTIQINTGSLQMKVIFLASTVKHY